MSGRLRWVVALALLAGVPWPAAPQVEQEDLAFADPLERSPEELQALFDRALAVFGSVDQPQSVPLWTELIGLLDAEPARGLEIRDGLLAASLLRRAEAYFNLGQNEEAEADLARALLVAPSLAPDEAQSSPKLVELFRKVRDRTIGRLALAVEPGDARIEIDGAPLFVAFLDGVPLLAGPHAVRASRPGYAPQTADVEIVAGAATALGIELERTSAVVRVRTNVPDVEVRIDGVPGGRTAAPLPAGEAAPAEGPVALAVAEASVDGLAIGVHELELSREGFRSLAARVAVEALVDYELAPFTLEETRGTVALSGIPDGARIQVDGVEPTVRPAAGVLSLHLPVGEHEVVVELGTVGAFAERLELADREHASLAVRLTPRAVLLGVLGGDLAAAERLTRDLAGAFAATPHWLFTDHSEAAAAALAEIGVDAVALRAGPRAEAAPDWPAVQGLADRRFPGSVYLLAALSDDLYATEAQVFLWPAAPGPASPEVSTVSLERPEALAAFASRFSEPRGFLRPRLGAALVDAIEGGTVVASIAASSPAERAGLAVGDRVTAVNGRPVERRAELDAAFAAAATPGSPAAACELTVWRGAEGSAKSLAIEGTSPVVLLEVEPEMPAAVAAAWVGLARVGGNVPPWVLGLNEAALFLALGQWPDAVRILRSLEAPEGPGLGRAAVDYWLGVALLETDPAAYGAQARVALERAAAAQGRLAHDDGPPVAPRARARLEALE